MKRSIESAMEACQLEIIPRREKFCFANRSLISYDFCNNVAMIIEA